MSRPQDFGGVEHVCCVTPALPPVTGGAEVSVQNLIFGLCERGIRVDVVVGNHVNQDVRSAVAAVGGEIVVVDSTHDGRALLWEQQSFRRAQDLSHFLEARKPDVVHTFSHASTLAAAMAFGPRSTGEPRPLLVATHHEMSTEDSPGGAARARFIYSLPQVDAYLPTSRYYRMVVERLSTTAVPIHPVRQGIDTHRFSSGDAPRGRQLLMADDGSPLLVCASRFVAWKGQQELLEALVLCRRADNVVPTVRFVGSLNAGSAEYLEGLHRYVRANDLEDQVRFVEDMPYRDMPDVLAAADAVAQPSWREGLGFAGLEAMASGACLIASDATGLDEFCLADQNCLIFKVRDVAGLRQCLTTAFTDPETMKRLQQAARTTVNRYDYMLGVDDHLDAYAQLVSDV